MRATSTFRNLPSISCPVPVDAASLSSGDRDNTCGQCFPPMRDQPYRCSVCLCPVKFRLRTDSGSSHLLLFFSLNKISFAFLNWWRKILKIIFLIINFNKDVRIICRTRDIIVKANSLNLN